MNEVCLNPQIIPIVVFFSAILPAVGTANPSKHIKDFINLEKQIKLFKSCRTVHSLFMA